MASLLVDDTPKDIKSMLTVIDTDPWLELGLQRLKPHAGSTPLRFKGEESGELVGWIETEPQSEWKLMFDNYYTYPGAPNNATVFINDNDAAVGIPSIKVGATFDNDISGAYIRIGDNTVIHNNSSIGSTSMSALHISPSAFLEMARIQNPRSLPSTLELRLEELKQLPEGWDSYGACRISDDAIAQARSVLLHTCALVGSEFCQQSFIAPAADGGLALEWDFASGKELILEIPPALESIEFLLSESTYVLGEKQAKGHIRQTEDLNAILLQINDS